jgi:hypothetical protein
MYDYSMLNKYTVKYRPIDTQKGKISLGELSDEAISAVLNHKGIRLSVRHVSEYKELDKLFEGTNLNILDIGQIGFYLNNIPPKSILISTGAYDKRTDGFDKDKFAELIGTSRYMYFVSIWTDNSDPYMDAINKNENIRCLHIHSPKCTKPLNMRAFLRMKFISIGDNTVY